MRESMPSIRRRLIVPAIAAVAIVAAAPLMPLLRDLLDRFPRGSLLVLGGVLGLAAIGALVVALVRIRDRHLLRYGGLVGVAGAIWLQSVGLGAHVPGTFGLRVFLLERLHIIEYGGLAVLLTLALRPLGLPAAASLAAVAATGVGLFDESVQHLVPSRTGEARDVAINAAAAVTGVAFALCVAPTSPRRGRPWGRTALAGLAALIAAVGVFVSVAHLGYEIDDPEVGRFLSWHSADELRDLSRQRAAAWQVDPPSGQELCCLQDYYLTEASRHNEHRTERAKAGDLVAAWHADNVLRKYFAPYLDKPLPDGRLPRKEVDRQAMEQAAAGRDPGSYRSPVLRGRIWTTPSRRLWLASSFGLAALLAVVAWRLPRPTRPDR